MKLTDGILFELSRLKNCFILDKHGQVMYVKGWKTEKVTTKSLFGGKTSSYDKLIEIHLVTKRDLGSGFISVISSDFTFSINELKKDRNRFIQMRNDLDAFGYVLKGKGK